MATSSKFQGGRQVLLDRPSSDNDNEFDRYDRDQDAQGEARFLLDQPIARAHRALVHRYSKRPGIGMQ